VARRRHAGGGIPRRTGAAHVTQRQTLILAVTLGVLFCALFIFVPGFDNGFYGDDFVLLERAAAAQQHPAIIWSRWVEPFNRPLAQAAFALEYRLWGMDAGRYILTNALVHVVNAVLLFWLFQGVLGVSAAAGAAVLFALGFGFYGKAVLWAANLPDLLATSFVLGTGIVARQAQMARLPQQRAASMALAGILYALALACKESGIMAMVLVAGLLWPQRRSVGSVVRKIAVLVTVCGTYLVLQFLTSSGIAQVVQDGGAWLALPVRALRLATLMTLPVMQESSLASQGGPLVARAVALVDQLRPALGLVLLLFAALWFWRGRGAVRWLLASYVAFLLPFGLIHLPEGWLDIRYAYLPATCFCGLAGFGLRALWVRSGHVGRSLLGIFVLLAVTADVMLVKQLERKYDGFGRSPEAQARRQELLQHLPAPPR
jgi:protein O-mannosyl-transferase